MTATQRPDDGRGHPGLVHDVLLAADEDELLEVSLDFARDGLENGEALVLTCAEAHSSAVLEELDLDGGRPDVHVLDHRLLQPRAPAALDQQLRQVRKALRNGADAVRVVGEPPVGLSPGAWREWARYEAASNHVFGDLPVWSRCVYDVRTTPAPMVEAARATHPRLATRGENPGYVPPAEFLASLSDPALLPIEGTEPLLAVGGIRSLAAVRDVRDQVHRTLVARHDDFPPHRELDLDSEGASGPGFAPHAPMSWLSVEDFVLAVHEVLANGVLHGGPPVGARLWAEADLVVCAVTDRGRGFDDPFVGYLRGTDGDDGNGNELPARMGLWLARQLSDDLTVRRDAAGFTVRLRAHLRT